MEAERADLAEAEKNLAAVLASEAASKNSCAQVAADHVVSVKAFAEEVKASRPEGALCCSLSACFAHLSCDEVWCGAGEDPSAKSEEIDHGVDQQVAVGGFIKGQPQVLLRWRVGESLCEERGPSNPGDDALFQA